MHGRGRTAPHLDGIDLRMALGAPLSVAVAGVLRHSSKTTAMSAVVDAPLAQVAIGSRVTLTWRDLPEGVALPRFMLESSK